MKIITANGKKTIRMSKSEWVAIGKKAGWNGDTYKEDEGQVICLDCKKKVNEDDASVDLDKGYYCKECAAKKIQK